MAHVEAPRSSEATHAADGHMDKRKRTTSRRFGRAVAWFATSVAAFAVAIGTVVAFPPVGAAFALAGWGSAALGAVYTIGGTASGINNSLSKA